MDNKKLIAQALLEIAKNSNTELIEDAKIDKEIKDAAKKMGLILPSEDFAVFKTKWADINKKNLNGVRLPRKAVEEGIQTLVGKNLNFEHLGAYNVCGFCLSVKINKDEIESINVFYKSLYPDKFEELKEKIKIKEAAVSFEIWNIDPATKKSVVKELEDGTREITKIICHGTGLLLVNPPACPTAKVFHLEAKQEIEDAEKIVDKKFNENLIYAELAIEEPKCKNCGTCNCEKEEQKVELEKLYADVAKPEDITFDLAMAFYYSSEEEQGKLSEDAAKWTRKFINDLPDSAFAVIEPDYPEKTENKNARHLPHHNGEGDLGKDKSNAKLDLPHYKNALARANQIKPVTDSISAEDLRQKAASHLERHKDALEKSSEETKAEVKSEETQTQETPKVETEVEAPETKPEEAKVEEAKTEQKTEEPVVAETKTEEPKAEETKEEIKVEAEAKPEEKSEEVAEEKKDEAEVETPETKPEDTAPDKGQKSEEKAQDVEVIEPKVIVKVISEFREVRISTFVDGTKNGEDEVKGYSRTITEYSDGTKDEMEEEVEIKKKYDLAEVEEKINEAKNDMQKTIDSKDKEISQLKQELDAKAQEIAELKPKEEPKKEIKMEVGSVEIKDRYEEIRSEINKAAFPKKDN